jgi:threonine synthase
LPLPPALRQAVAQVFAGVSASEPATVSAMLATWESTGQLIDPHTAVAVAGATGAPAPSAGTPLVILSTAHPAKFPQAVRAATGQTPPAPPAAARLDGLTERFERLPADVEAVKAYVRAWA